MNNTMQLNENNLKNCDVTIRRWTKDSHLKRLLKFRWNIGMLLNDNDLIIFYC